MNYKLFEKIFLDDKCVYISKILQDYNFCVEKKLVCDFLSKWIDSNDYIEFFTSGSTGSPQKVLLYKNQMINSAYNTINYLKLNKNDVFLHCIPANYIGGAMMIVRAIVLEANIIFVNPSKNPLKDISQKIDFMAITPYQFYELIDNEANKLKKINNIIIGGASVDRIYIQKIINFKNNIYSTYGMTETYSHIAMMKLNIKENYYTSIFPNIISINSENKIIINCPNLLIDKLITNDIGEYYKNGFRIKGRIDNVINSGGIKINLIEVENIIKDNSNIDIITFGRKCKKLGEELCLIIPQKFEQLFLNEFNKIKFEKYKKPRIYFITDKYFYTPTNKIDRKKTIDYCIKKFYPQNL